MICVYPANCTDFSGNGLGVVTPMSCTVTETLNGEWELTLVHDIDERGKWTRLSEGCILRAPVPAAMTPSVGLVTQQYQTSTYDVQIYKITTKSGPLHLRSGTGTNYRILGKYKKGREVIVLNKTTSGWYEVTAPDGKHGYQNAQLSDFASYRIDSDSAYNDFSRFQLSCVPFYPNDVMKTSVLHDLLGVVNRPAVLFLDLEKSIVLCDIPPEAEIRYASCTDDRAYVIEYNSHLGYVFQSE